jgi:hypothetical protein
MEHRYSERSNTELNIVIYKQNARVALGVITNISGDGIFIKSGFDELSTNQPIEIEVIGKDSALSGEQLAESKRFFSANRFSATVVHRSAQGFGAEIEQSSLANMNSSLTANQNADTELRILATR